MTQTRNNKERGKDTLIFGCHSELDRDRWIAAIDYLKIKSGYDVYKKRNSLINFLGRDEKDESSDNSEDAGYNFDELIYDFGKKFKKNQTSVVQAAAFNASNFVKNEVKGTFEM